MPSRQWSDDAFLDALRAQGDPEADAVIAALLADGETRSLGALFKVLQANDTPLPAAAPAPLHAFMAASPGLPANLDVPRLQRGGAAFLKNALPSVVVLLASSLPRGYAAPCLCEILTISDDLGRHPFDRLMGVVQLLINISDPAAFTPHGRAIVTARKLRLLHAGIRSLTPKYRPEFVQRYGVPVNHEDMLATIMGFSYLLVDGIGRLHLPLEEAEAEDLYYLWRIFALLMGIHPPGSPDDDRLIPASLAEAAEFYVAYVSRNNRMPAANPAGVTLTQANLAMMERLLPAALRWVGLGYAPRLCMTQLMTADELARVGFAPLPGHRLLRAALRVVMRLSQRMEAEEPFSAMLARLLLQGMVDIDRDGQVEFGVALDRLGLRGRDFD